MALSLRKLIFAVASAALFNLALATPVAAIDPVCAALVATASDGSPQGRERTIAYYGVNEPDAIFSVVCSFHEEDHTSALCSVVANNSSHEFLNVFAYQVVECVEAHGEVQNLTTSSESSGLMHHPRAVSSMSGHLGRSEVLLHAREGGGFSLTFRAD
jgi:hypothetical protein